MSGVQMPGITWPTLGGGPSPAVRRAPEPPLEIPRISVVVQAGQEVVFQTEESFTLEMVPRSGPMVQREVVGGRLDTSGLWSERYGLTAVRGAQRRVVGLLRVL